MNRKEFVRRVATVLRENDIRKPVSSHKQVLHISDDDGNTSDFVIKKTDKGVLFTYDDVESIIDTCISVIEDAIKHGEHISIRGFGTLALHYRKARRTKHPDTGEDIEVSERYIPKFTYGNDLRMCAKIFELSLEEGLSTYNESDDSDIEGGECNGD